MEKTKFKYPKILYLPTHLLGFRAKLNMRRKRTVNIFTTYLTCH